MQGLGSVQNLCFFFCVLGFLIGLSPRTMQVLGSVQNLCFFFCVLGFPIGLSPKTMQGLGSVQNLLGTYLLFSQVSPLAMTGELTWGRKPLEMPVPLALQDVSPGTSLYRSDNCRSPEMGKTRESLLARELTHAPPVPTRKPSHRRRQL